MAPVGEHLLLSVNG